MRIPRRLGFPPESCCRLGKEGVVDEAMLTFGPQVIFATKSAMPDPQPNEHCSSKGIAIEQRGCLEDSRTDLGARVLDRLGRATKLRWRTCTAKVHNQLVNADHPTTVETFAGIASPISRTASRMPDTAGELSRRPGPKHWEILRR